MKNIKEQFKNFLKENLFATSVLAYSFFLFLFLNIYKDIIFL